MMNSVYPYSIESASENHHDEIWQIFHHVIQSGETYAFDPETSMDEMKRLWLAEYMHTYVVLKDEEVVGTYVLKPNHPGLGSHIANGSYMVHPECRGGGIGKLMCEHSISEATKLGYKGIQFNLVVSNNEAAVAVWKKYGFEIIGTIPNGFFYRREKYVDAYIMYRSLEN